MKDRRGKAEKEEEEERKRATEETEEKSDQTNERRRRREVRSTHTRARSVCSSSRFQQRIRSAESTSGHAVSLPARAVDACGDAL